MALTMICLQNRSIARGGWRCSFSQSSIVIRSRSVRRWYWLLMALIPRITAIFSDRFRNLRLRKDSGKCAGAGSIPERSTLRRPPGSIKMNSR